MMLRRATDQRPGWNVVLNGHTLFVDNVLHDPFGKEVWLVVSKEGDAAMDRMRISFRADDMIETVHISLPCR